MSGDDPGDGGDDPPARGGPPGIGLLAAVQFLTRVPVRLRRAPDPARAEALCVAYGLEEAPRRKMAAFCAERCRMYQAGAEVPRPFHDTMFGVAFFYDAWPPPQFSATPIWLTFVASASRQQTPLP